MLIQPRKRIADTGWLIRRKEELQLSGLGTSRNFNEPGGYVFDRLQNI